MYLLAKIFNWFLVISLDFVEDQLLRRPSGVGKSQGEWSKPHLSLEHDAEIGQDCKDDCDASVTFAFSTIWITEPAGAGMQYWSVLPEQ